MSISNASMIRINGLINTKRNKDEIAVTDIRTDKQIMKDESDKPWGQDVFAYQGGGKGIVAPSIADSGFVKETFDESHYIHSYWVYDTPGVINSEQTFNLLDPEDCIALQPVNVMNPRCVALKPSTTIYVSGMARLDFVEGDEMVMLTVHTSSDIPIQVVTSDQANKYYFDNIGSSNFKLPTGDTDRLNQIPSLVAKEFKLEGIGETEAVADIQFSSIGWVSIAAKEGSVVKLRAFTPARKGLHLRQPALLPKITQFKGKKIRGTPFFNPRRIGSPVIGKDINVLL